MSVLQTYFCSALSSKVRHMRLKRKQDAVSFGGSKNAADGSPSKKKVKQKAKLAAVAEHGSPAKRPLSASDFNKYKTEMQVCRLGFCSW